MEIKELMIGDWIRYSPKSISLNNNYGGLYRAEGVSQDTISLGAKNYRFVVSDKEIDPIPLTTEILEKNGWEQTEYCHEYRDDKNTIQCRLPYMVGRINGIEIERFKCKYVHQYQHLLRLCGLDELANNFKI